MGGGGASARDLLILTFLGFFVDSSIGEVPGKAGRAIRYFGLGTSGASHPVHGFGHSTLFIDVAAQNEMGVAA